MKKKILTAALAAAALAPLSMANAQEQEYVGTARLTSAATTPITLRVNNNYYGVTVDWGDGNPILYKDCTGTEREITGTPKGTIVISGYAGWDMLDCSDCQLTSLDVTVATNLHSVFCQDNQLTELDLRGMANLTDLDCSGNQLTTITTEATDFSSVMTGLEMLNLADNQLEGKFTVKANNLQVANLSNNAFTLLTLSNPNLNALYCDGNKLVGLGLKSNAKLATLVTYNNAITKLSLPADLPNMQQLVVSGNKLYNTTKLDLGEATSLKDIDVENCGLTSFITPKNMKVNTLNVAHNTLPLAVLPLAAYKPAQYKFEPQNPLDITKVPGVIMDNGVPRIDVTTWANRTKAEYQLDLSEYRYIGRTEGTTGKADADYTWFRVDKEGQETEMVKGTSSSAPGDYYALNGKFAFFTPQGKAYVRITSKTYGVSVNFKPIAIGDDITAIETVENTQEGLQVHAQGGEIILSAGQQQPVSIYTISGQRVWTGNVGAEGQRVSLPKGIYVVGGKKVLN